ncbi:HAD-IB family phosphatase [Candidatus Berkelbacteria bacterium]|nr:HAD-IB family phosphatase [Candidatus Berkelbacteria bacterium]
MTTNKQIQIVFNFDSTLVAIEGTFELAKRKGIDAKAIEAARDSIIEGQEAFNQSFVRRFEQYRPSFSDIAWLAEAYYKAIVPEAKDVIAELKKMGCQIHIVSSSYRPAILKTARALGIEPFRVCAVDLEFDEVGNYQSFDDDNILTSIEGYKIVLAEIAKLGPVVYIGDSVRDLEVSQDVDLFVGFGGIIANKQVEQQSDTYIVSLKSLPAKIKELKENLEGNNHQSNSSYRIEASANDHQKTF